MKTLFLRDLKGIADLIHPKFNKKNFLINNLKLQDVYDFEAYTILVEAIKNKVYFEEVIIYDGEYKDFNYNIDGLYIHEIQFPFTGDAEIFSYCGLSSVNHSDQIYSPEDGKFISIKIETSDLQKPEAIISLAKEKLAKTYQVILANNEFLKRIRLMTENDLDKQLADKREELIRLFSDN